MKKWILALPVLIMGVLIIRWYYSEPRQVFLEPETVIPLRPEAFKQETLKRPASLENSPKTIPLSQRLDSQRPLKIGNKNYQILEGKLAITSAQAQRLNINSEARVGGWVIIDERDAPLDVVSYPLLQREGSATIGIFRGVIKAQSFNALMSSDISHCPGTVLSAMPAIKISLIELNSSSSPDELKSCLTETRLFSRLEWEILDQPRLAR